MDQLITILKSQYCGYNKFNTPIRYIKNVPEATEFFNKNRIVYGTATNKKTMTAEIRLVHGLVVEIIKIVAAAETPLLKAFYRVNSMRTVFRSEDILHIMPDGFVSNCRKLAAATAKFKLFDTEMPFSQWGQPRIPSGMIGPDFMSGDKYYFSGTTDLEYRFTNLSKIFCNAVDTIESPCSKICAIAYLVDSASFVHKLCDHGAKCVATYMRMKMLHETFDHTNQTLIKDIAKIQTSSDDLTNKIKINGLIVPVEAAARIYANRYYVACTTSPMAVALIAAIEKELRT